MVSESERVGEITVSKGDYGRLLLHSDDAGEAVVKYVDKVCNDEVRSSEERTMTRSYIAISTTNTLASLFADLKPS